MAADITPLRGPAFAGLEAHVYVLRFQNGLIKVGYSANVPQRIRQHQDNGAAYGNPVTAQWASAPHLRASENERALIAYCEAHGQQSQGREWFTGVSFDDVCTYAATLPVDRATRDDIEQHQRDMQSKADALMASLNFPPPGRTITLPPQVDASTLAALPDGPGEEAVWPVLAELLKLTVEEVALLPDDAQRLVLVHLANHWNRHQEVTFLGQLLEDAQKRLRLNATTELEALRRSVRDRLTTPVATADDTRLFDTA